MFKASIKGNRIKEAITALTTMVDEARFNLFPESVSVSAVDPANVAMVAMELGKSAFESFEATAGVLGIDLTKLLSFLEMSEKEGVVELELDEQNRKLKLVIKGLAYTMSLLDPKAIRKEPKVPSLDLPAILSISGTDFKYGMKAADKIADYVTMTMNTDGTEFSLSASGDTDDVTYSIPADRMKITKASEAKSMFATEYLTKIQKQADKTSELTINLGKDYPVKIGFPICEGNGTILYMIAPRVEGGD